MSYPPPEGFPPTAPQTNATQPTVGFPPQPPAVSAAPAYSPALAQISGTPYASSEGRRRPPVLALAIAASLLLVFGALMVGLYVNTRGDLGDTKANLRDTRADLTSQVQEQKTLVADQQEKLAAAEKRATDLNTQLNAMRTSAADVKAQRDALVPCMRRIQDTFDAAADGNSAGVSSGLRQARTACDKAEIKVDS
jgi:hypothetical protein